MTKWIVWTSWFSSCCVRCWNSKSFGFFVMSQSFGQCWNLLVTRHVCCRAWKCCGQICLDLSSCMLQVTCGSRFPPVSLFAEFWNSVLTWVRHGKKVWIPSSWQRLVFLKFDLVLSLSRMHYRPLSDMPAKSICIHPWWALFFLRVSITAMLTSLVHKSKQRWLHSNLDWVHAAFDVCLISWVLEKWETAFLIGFSLTDRPKNSASVDWILELLQTIPWFWFFFFEIRRFDCRFWHSVHFVVVWNSVDPLVARFWECRSKVCCWKCKSNREISFRVGILVPVDQQSGGSRCSRFNCLFCKAFSFVWECSWFHFVMWEEKHLFFDFCQLVSCDFFGSLGQVVFHPLAAIEFWCCSWGVGFVG